MAIAALLDTNVVLYSLGGRLAEPLPAGRYLVSVITELELLSYPLLDAESERYVREFLNAVEVVELTPEVKDTAIQLRRSNKMKLPDAIVAASAMACGVELVTNDSHILRISSIRSRAPALKSDK